MTSPSGTVLWPLGPNYEIANGVATKYLAVPGLGLVAKRVGAQTSWIHTDGLGSVHVLTDVTGTPGPRRTYRPFGETLSGSLDEPRGFVGERLDSDTGLTQMGARYYRADLGIFLSPDPANADLASYAYAYGSPFQFRDPTGLAGEPPEPMRLPGIEVHCPPSGIGDQCPTIGTSPQLWIIMQYVMGIGLFQSRNCNLGYDCPPASIPTGYE
jgi:RHS repeat-associated protein